MACTGQVTPASEMNLAGFRHSRQRGCSTIAYRHPDTHILKGIALRTGETPGRGPGVFSFLADFQCEEEKFNLLKGSPVTVTQVLAAGEQCRKSPDPLTGRQRAKSAAIPGTSLTLASMLCDEDRAILDFERASWREPGPKDLTIEFVLGLTATEYYERLRAIVGTASAYLHDPLTVKRVMRIIEVPTETELAV